MSIVKATQLEPLRIELEQHRANQSRVGDLLSFDDAILNYCILALKHLEERLRNNEEVKITVAPLLPAGTIKALEGIREHESFREQYAQMFNQCLVLSVSYFTSALHSIFVKAVNHACCCCPDLLSVKKGDIKFTFAELRACEFNLVDHLGELIVNKKDVSFQNIEGALQAFKDFLGVEIESDQHVHNVILALASRHVIVHSLGVTDQKFLSLLDHAPNRSVKRLLGFEYPLFFEPAEIHSIQQSMDVVLSTLIDAVSSRVASVSEPAEDDVEFETA
jgi:hypothetical protein